MEKSLETATIANGCFWCTEAVFKRLKGVVSVEPGYSGGNTENPSYYEVCSGTTGHAETIQIQFDPRIISYDKILEVFWHTHDPTTLNRQGNDVGIQYRSAIFYHDARQRQIAEESKKKIEAEGIWTNPIVTKIEPFKAFYPAENYHKNYYDNNPDKPYCTFIINPKIQKLMKEFGNDVKKEYK